MHEIEPYNGWQKYYDASKDAKSPFHGRRYGNEYVNDVYGYYIHPDWDEIDSETLYCKLLFVDYKSKYAVIEIFGEWNDTLHNDVMFLKRKVIDNLTKHYIDKFILIGENLFQFHGGDDDYYEEWLEDVEDGWIAAVNFRDFIQTEFRRYRIDHYINLGGTLDIENWRTLKPLEFCNFINGLIMRRLT
jgi:hypothetical protein